MDQQVEQGWREVEGTVVGGSHRMWQEQLEMWAEVTETEGPPDQERTKEH